MGSQQRQACDGNRTAQHPTPGEEEDWKRAKLHDLNNHTSKSTSHHQPRPAPLNSSTICTPQIVNATSQSSDVKSRFTGGNPHFPALQKPSVPKQVSDPAKNTRIHSLASIASCVIAPGSNQYIPYITSVVESRFPYKPISLINACTPASNFFVSRNHPTIRAFRQ